MLQNVIPWGTPLQDTFEIWEQRRPVMGEHIRVQRYHGLYAHHGIYVSDEEVIHFTGIDDDSILDWSKCKVIRTDLERFLDGGVLEVKVYTEEELDDLYTPAQIVQYARFCLGDTGYHLLFNNCEHFANVCTLGQYRSQQVERVFSGPYYEEENKLGLFGSIGKIFGKIFGGSSNGRTTHAYTYEPDKVKMAEMDNATKVKLAHLSNEQVELVKQARLEIIQCQTQSELALKEAQARGLSLMAQTIVEMQKQLNDIAQKRLLIIEQGSAAAVQEIESMYSQLEDKIQKDNDTYNTEKLPKLLALLEQYDENSAAHKLYEKRIADDMNLQLEHMGEQLKTLSCRQDKLIDSLVQDKEKMLDQTNELTLKMLTSLNQQLIALQEYAGQKKEPRKSLKGEDYKLLSSDSETKDTQE